MNRIDWKQEWNLEHKTIDDQHKFLVSILNRIITNKLELLELIKNLIDYSAEHFIDEEELMYQTGYSKEKRHEHIREHYKFKNTLLEISFALIPLSNKEDKEELIEAKLKLEHFCFKWFEIHFLETDKDFVDFLHKGGAIQK